MTQCSDDRRHPLASQSVLWFGLSLLVAVLFALDGLRLAFQSPYTVHNDARQHVFWMQRFLDPTLFPADLIADYFQSVAPLGYAMLYKLFASMGIDPLVLNKVLPGILGILATVYCFRVCIHVLPVPFAGFLASLLLNQNLWLRDDLSSGTPRAFIYPLLLAWLYSLLRGSLLPCLAIILLQGLFYPHTVFIAIAMLCLQLCRRYPGCPNSFRHRHPYVFCLTGLGIAGLVLLPYALRLSDFGPIITRSEARRLPEFSSQGRTALFLPNAWVYWLCAERTGLFPSEWQYVVLFSFGWLVFLLRKYPARFPLAYQMASARVMILIDLLIASLGMFVLAHLFLFTFHLPSRYTQHSLRILMALVDGMFIAVVVATTSAWITQKLPKCLRVASTCVTLVTGCVVVAGLVYPSYAVRAYPHRLGYLTGEAASLYRFLRQQPQDVLVASLTPEADFIPTFAQRSVLVSQEYAIPYHTGYYRQLRQRTLEMLSAQYSPEITPVQGLIQEYGIDLWLLERQAFQPGYMANNPWLMQFQPAASAAVDRMQQGKQPALARLLPACAVFAEQKWVVLDALCLLSAGVDD